MDFLKYPLPPLNERASMPAMFLPSFYLVLVTSILVQPPWLRKVLVTTVLLLYLWAYLHVTQGPDLDRQNMTMIVTSVLMWLEFNVIGNSERDLFRTWEQPSPADERSMLKRLAWSYDLWTTWRGCGWNWESRRSPKLPDHVVNRRTFLIDNVKWGTYCWVMSQILLYLLEVTPYTRILERQHLNTAPLHVQIAVVWIAACYTQYSMSFMYRFLTSVLVLVGICAPFQCPPLFGSFTKMYTVNNLWAISWQHMMRRAILLFPNIVVFTLGVDGWAAKYTRLVLAFVVSGAIHAAGSLNATRHSLGDMRMFVSQAAAIIVEDCVISLGKRLGIKKSNWTIALGFLWTYSWFSFCLRAWGSQLFWAGMFASEGYSSVVSRVIR